MSIDTIILPLANAANYFYKRNSLILTKYNNVWFLAYVSSRICINSIRANLEKFLSFFIKLVSQKYDNYAWQLRDYIILKTTQLIFFSPKTDPELYKKHRFSFLSNSKSLRFTFYKSTIYKLFTSIVGEGNRNSPPQPDEFNYSSLHQIVNMIVYRSLEFPNWNNYSKPNNADSYWRKYISLQLFIKKNLLD